MNTARKRLPLLLPVILLLLLLPPYPARASLERSRALNDQAMKLYGQKKYSQAVKLLLQAYKEFPTPKINLGLGNCYLKMGAYRQAVKSYETVLARVVMSGAVRKRVSAQLEKARRLFNKATVPFTIDSTPSGATVVVGKGLIQGETRLTGRLRPGRYTVFISKKGYLSQQRAIKVPIGLPYTMHVVLKRPPVFGKLDVRATVLGSTISIDGRKVGCSPIKGLLKLKPGIILVKGEKKGYRAAVQKAVITAGKTTRVLLKLRALPRVKDKPRLAIPLVPKKKQKRKKTPSRAMAVWKWVTLGIGAAAAAVGTTHAALSYRNYKRLQSTGTAGREAIKKDGERDQTLAIIEFSICGAALITSLVLFMMDKKRPAGKRLSLGLAPLPGGALVTTGFRF